MHIVSRPYELLGQANIVPGTEITDIESLGHFDLATTYIGNCMLAHPCLPAEPGMTIIPSEQTLLRPIKPLRPEASSTIAERLQKYLDTHGPGSISRLGMLVVEPTLPGSTRYVEGLFTNVLACVRLANDKVIDMETQVYIEKILPRHDSEGVIRARKIMHPPRVQSPEEFMVRLKELLAPRMHRQRRHGFRLIQGGDLD